MYYVPIYPNAYFKEFVAFDGYAYELSFHWASVHELDGADYGTWFMSIREINDEFELNNIKMVTGINLLAPFGKLIIGSLVLVDTLDQDGEPTFDDFGSRFKLIYIGVDEDI